jgi:hypothetical protein
MAESSTVTRNERVLILSDNIDIKNLSSLSCKHLKCIILNKAQQLIVPEWAW